MAGLEPPVRVHLTDERVRMLTATDLGLISDSAFAAPSPGLGEIQVLPADDPYLLRALDLAKDYGGIIFTGPPGTSKSWYAQRIAYTLSDQDPRRLSFVQFHPSYQYEDFVEGYVPTSDGGGFELRPKHFIALCDAARKAPNDLHVLVIDELSRGDPGRVFGEALTYLERSKRGIPFQLASGRQTLVPENVLVLATMNPQDRGVDEVDAALERRFAKIAMEPDSEEVGRFITAAGMDDALRDRVIEFFKALNGRARTNPHAALGHTYFAGVGDEDALRRLWEHQLRFHVDKAFRLNPEEAQSVYAHWNRVLDVAQSETPAPEEA